MLKRPTLRHRILAASGLSRWKEHFLAATWANEYLVIHPHLGYVKLSGCKCAYQRQCLDCTPDDWPGCQHSSPSHAPVLVKFCWRKITSCHRVWHHINAVQWSKVPQETTAFLQLQSKCIHFRHFFWCHQHQNCVCKYGAVFDVEKNMNREFWNRWDTSKGHVMQSNHCAGGA